MNNANELRTQLTEVFMGLKDGTIQAKDASEFANIAGKMINSAKIQVEYYALRKEIPTIPFLNED